MGIWFLLREIAGEISLVIGTSRGGWGRGGFWKSYKSVNKGRVYFKYLLDSRIKC